MSKKNNCKCNHCGKEFFEYPSDIKAGQGKHCSQACYNESKKVMNEYRENGKHIVISIEYKDEVYDCLIDKDDKKQVQEYQWHIVNKSNSKYVESSVDNNIYLHRLLMDFPDGLEVDHKNGNPLDNRRDNLRLVTHHKQMMNRSANKGSACPEQAGVYRDNRNGSWYAQIEIDDDVIHLGTFDSVENAIEARKHAEQKHFGEYARSSNT